jgi:hypothetical protein
VWLQFEDPDELGSSNFAINTGTLSLPAGIATESDPHRDTSDPYEGSACASFISSGPGSFGFSLGGSTVMDFTDGRIQMAIEPDGVSGVEAWFEWGSDADNRFVLFFETGVPKVFLRRGGVGTIAITSSGGAISDGNWHLIEWTSISGTMTLYVDSVSVGTASAGGAFTQAAFGNQVRWGRVAYAAEAYFLGRMDDFRLYRLS